MKKYLSYCLVMLICVLSLTGCDAKKTIKNIGQPKEIDYPGTASCGEKFETYASGLIKSFSTTQETEIKRTLSESEEYIEQSKSAKPIIEGLSSYYGSREELGDFVEVGKITYVEDRKNLYLATVKTKYKKRDCNVKIQFSIKEDYAELYENDDAYMESVEQGMVEPKYDFEIKSMTFDPAYTFKETLSKAGMNTLLGMGTVFSVLILIAFIISLFKIINKIETAAKNKEAKKVAAENAKEIEKIDSTPVVETTQTDDNELIAVIAAAIAASEGNADPGSFVVRSIRKIR